ncbi:MAG: tRNA (adenosine(37)-N6)-dimethylallyltransferase MiaA [Lentisphaeraceae bacterium]|nr:tRNA (adenosine(37)-N6)-dimethylallyltransferase MiaA [Lentisphaeraceae bacterium]
MKSKIIIVTGPTATGKTKLAVSLCRKFSGELISADSRQVYRGLDIGTGKDLADFIADDGDETPYHLMDVCEPADEFSLFHWREAYIDASENIVQRGKLPVICGGTPLYLDMLLRNYELQGQARDDKYQQSLANLSLEELQTKLKKFPELYDKTDISQKARVLRALEISANDEKPQRPLPKDEYLVIAPYWHRKIVHARIEKRLKQRWPEMLTEVKGLLAAGVTHERLEWFGLEYRYMSRMMLGQLNEKEAFDQLLIKIRQFAKRQDIWFRKMEKSGIKIHWLKGEGAEAEAEVLVKKFLAGESLPEPQICLKDIIYGPRTQ